MTVIKTAFSNGCFGFGPCGGRKADRVRSGNPRAASCAGGADRAAAGRFERTAAAALGRSPRSFGCSRMPSGGSDSSDSAAALGRSLRQFERFRAGLGNPRTARTARAALTILAALMARILRRALGLLLGRDAAVIAERSNVRQRTFGPPLRRDRRGGEVEPVATPFRSGRQGRRSGAVRVHCLAPCSGSDGMRVRRSDRSPWSVGEAIRPSMAYGCRVHAASGVFGRSGLRTGGGLRAGPFHKRGYRTFRQDTLVAVAVRAARISWLRGTRRAAYS